MVRGWRGVTAFFSQEGISKATRLVALETFTTNSMAYNILPDARCEKSRYSLDLHNLP